jgi:L-fuculose-phosphate aldolase
MLGPYLPGRPPSRIGAGPPGYHRRVADFLVPQPLPPEPGPPGALDAARAALAALGPRMLADGLAVGRAGNLSVRVGDAVAITPSGVSYDELEPADICVVPVVDGAVAGGALTEPTGRVPSSETPLHLAVYAATPALAVVHTHSPEVVALSAVRDVLPAIHYTIAMLGGPVRVVPYARFGSAELAALTAAGLRDRSAVILGQHGAVCSGASLAQAYERAQLLEWLARCYRLAGAYGRPRLLTDGQLAQVAAELTRRNYGATPAPADGDY